MSTTTNVFRHTASKVTFQEKPEYMASHATRWYFSLLLPWETKITQTKVTVIFWILSPSSDITDIRQSKSETWSTNNSSYQFKIPASLYSWRGLLPRNRILLHTLYYRDPHIPLTKVLDSEQVCETGILLQAKYNNTECQLFCHYCLGLFLTLLRRKSVRLQLNYRVINSNLVKLYGELSRKHFFICCA